MAREGERERGGGTSGHALEGAISIFVRQIKPRETGTCVWGISISCVSCFSYCFVKFFVKKKNPHLDSPCFGLFRSPYQCCDHSTVNQHTHADRKKGLEMTLPQTLTLVPQYTSLSWPRVDTAAALQSPFFPLCHCVCNEMQRRSGSKPVFRDAGQWSLSVLIDQMRWGSRVRGDPLRYAAASAVCLTPVSLSRGLKGSFGF